MSQRIADDPLHNYIKPTSIIDIYYADDSVQYASEIGMLYNIQESGGVYYLSIAPKKRCCKTRYSNTEYFSKKSIIIERSCFNG